MQKLTALAVFIAIVVSLSSCDGDFLTRYSSTDIPTKDVYSDPGLMKMFVNSMYLKVPGYDHGLYDNISDQSRSYWGGAPLRVVRGQWGPTYNPMGNWAFAYDAIRETNTFLSNVEESTVEGGLKRHLKGQVKFLRALHYFKLVKRYGGVPIITEPQSVEDSLYVRRASIDETFKFIIAELHEAIELLPESYGTLAVDVSRANKWSAKAYLGRVLLFWASPLYNPNGDVSRWERAATINKEVIESGVYSLHPEFSDIWTETPNEEMIYAVQYEDSYREHGWDSWAMPDSRSFNDAVRRSPVQEFVEAFEMENGKGIHEQGSGYDPAHPYENRDPRFYYTLITTGSYFFGDPVNMTVNSPTKDGIGGPYATITGYLVQKMTDSTNTDYYGQTGSDQPWIELRFAEVLLNYAEARNEASGPDQSVYNAVEQIRKRAGLDPYQLSPGLSKQEMREVIRHERYIELAFERKRYWDLRRWKTAVERLNGETFHAMYITKHEDGSYTYDKRPLNQGPYVFTEKMYFLPIPASEMRKNPKLEQNPGW